MGKTRMGQNPYFDRFDGILAVMMVLATMLGEGNGNYGLISGFGSPPVSSPGAPGGHAHQPIHDPNYVANHPQANWQNPLINMGNMLHPGAGGQGQGPPLNQNPYGAPPPNPYGAPPPDPNQYGAQPPNPYGAPPPNPYGAPPPDPNQYGAQPPNPYGAPPPNPYGAPPPDPNQYGGSQEPDPQVVPGEYQYDRWGKRYYFQYDLDVPGTYRNDPIAQKWIYERYSTPLPGMYSRDPADGKWKFYALGSNTPYAIQPEGLNSGTGQGATSGYSPPPPPPSPPSEVLQPVNPPPSSNLGGDTGPLTESEKDIVEVAVQELAQQIEEGVVGAIEEDEALAVEEEKIKNAQAKSSQLVLSNLAMITLVFSVVKLC